MAVTATGWTAYAFPVSRSAGSHKVEVGFINDHLGGDCDRNLLVDTVTVR